MIEDRCGIAAVFVPDDCGRAAMSFFTDYQQALGSAGNETVHWRYIGRPGASDEIYRSMRTRKLRARDDASLDWYIKDSHVRGGESHRNREEYQKVIAALDLVSCERPLVLFAAAPDNGVRAVLHLPIILLDTANSRRMLGEFLVRNLTESNALQYSENGVFTEQSMYSVQSWMCKLEGELESLANVANRTASLSAGPVLILEEVLPPTSRGRSRARVVGYGEFAGVSKILGPRQFFFIESFFASIDDRLIEDCYCTVVSLDLMTQELLLWSRLGILRFTGSDSPKTRLRKMWREFVKEMSGNVLLSRLFPPQPYQNDGEYLFLMRLRTSQTQSRIKNLSALFDSD